VTFALLGVSWFVWSGAAAVLPALFTRIQISEHTAQTTGAAHFVLRWFHAITWVVLAASFFVRGVASEQSTVADAVGVTALAMYVAFRAVWRRTSPCDGGATVRTCHLRETTQNDAGTCFPCKAAGGRQRWKRCGSSKAQQLGSSWTSLSLGLSSPKALRT
jgi:hypothetical protein